jgi:hypothetical protein
MTRRPKSWPVSGALMGESRFVVKTRQGNRGRLFQDKAGGRPRNFDDAAKIKLMNRLEPYLLKRQVELGRLPYRKDEKLLKFVRGLVECRIGLERGYQHQAAY